MGFLDKYASQILGITRIVAGLIFLEHGAQKLLGFPPGMSPPMFSIFWCAGAIELVAGRLDPAGPVQPDRGLHRFGEMAFAYFMGHFPKSIFPAQNGGDAAILFCFPVPVPGGGGTGQFRAQPEIARRRRRRALFLRHARHVPADAGNPFARLCRGTVSHGGAAR